MIFGLVFKIGIIYFFKYGVLYIICKGIFLKLIGMFGIIIKYLF